MEQEIVTAIHYTTIAIILRQADLQPHRSRYWKTTVWDEAAIFQSREILWCYEHVKKLWEQGSGTTSASFVHTATRFMAESG